MSEGTTGQNSNTNVGFVENIDISDGSVKDAGGFEGEETNLHIGDGSEGLEKSIGTADITLRSTSCIGGTTESDDAQDIPMKGDDRSTKVITDTSLSNSTAGDGSHVMETTESSQSEPKVGMVFHSEEEAYNFYNTYAKRRGFSVRKGHLSRRRDNSIRDRHYVCSNEGTRQEHRTHVSKRPRPLERTNCLARIEFKVNRSNVWVLHKFVDEHNHPLATANKIHLLRSHRKKMPPERAIFTAADYYFGAKPAQLHNNQAADICSLENAGFLRKNQPNCLSIKRTRDLEKGDTQFLLEYLKTKQSEDPSFFYAVQLDEKEKLTNFFWADGRSINDYFHFGDTLTFDTTYRTSKFDIPFAPFIGVNHHKQIVIFGGALLLDDSTETFTWLFRTFLAAMSGKQPKTILTDCFDAISDAISMILPNSCHRICLWHILQSIPKSIHSVSSRETNFQKDFENCAFGVSSEEDFQKSWDSLISKLPMGSSSWMKDLYAVRGKWALPYIGNAFVATMATKQWTESMENLFKIYFYRKLPLPKFISQYFNSLIKFREKELYEDYESRQSKPVDHAWSFRLSDALKQLMEVPGLAERMAALMCVDLDLKSNAEKLENNAENDEKSCDRMKVLEVVERELQRTRELGADAVTWLELEELGIDDEMLQSLDLSAKFPNLIALNLWGNKLQDAEAVVREVTKCRCLKAIWLNDNPVLEDRDVVSQAILDGIPGLEICNSRFTDNSDLWAIGFCGETVGVDNPICSTENTDSLAGITVLDLSNRCAYALPKAFSPAVLPSLSNLNLRGNPLDKSSSDDILALLSNFPCLQVLEVDIPGPLGNSALRILECLPNLSLLNGVSTSIISKSGKHVIDSVLQPRLPEWKTTDPLADRIVAAMWLYLMTYRLADEEKIDETSIWYVMDELGSALRHSDDANFKVAPFLFMPDGKLTSAVSYSVLWPTTDIHVGEECTRDFLFGIGEDKQRSARLTAWFHTPENYFIHEFKKYQQQLKSNTHSALAMEAPTTRRISRNDGHALRVYSDIPQVEEFLTRPEFVLTIDPKDADIIWTSMQVDPEVKKALGLTDYQFTNQFPFEACIVMKHHLAETIHKAQGNPAWLQPTYNLETHLSQLIGDYCVRKQEGLNNLWILKPWNMARTIDTTVTGDLSAIIRLMETGPKICQKYIEHPALFRGRKFDLRYIVLVRSMSPVEIFLADVFWVRLANNKYTLEKSSLFEYETHFTVMNYRGTLNHMQTPDFVREFEEEHQVKWLTIHQRIQKMIRSVFDSAAAVHPEMHSPQSRAMYGVDVMLDNTFMPKLLEVTYCPDCNRACKYDTAAVVGNNEVIRGRDFFNFVFGCLFLDESRYVTPL